MSEEFLVTGRLWFVGPYPPEGNTPQEICGSIPPMSVEKNGKSGSVMPVFTDEDLAQKYAEKLRAIDGKEYRPLSWPNTELAFALAFLASIGETHLVFDPESGLNHGRLFSITQVLDGLVNNPR